MIRFIAAIDAKRGLANQHGIPWQGKIPPDVQYFRNKTIGGKVLMGMGWYKEQKQPLTDRENLVATKTIEKLRPGFKNVGDARAFLQTAKDDIWVGGGAAVFASTIDLADELYLTLLDGDFGCTKFFPDFESRFTQVTTSDPISENGITFRFTVWKPKK